MRYTVDDIINITGAKKLDRLTTSEIIKEAIFDTRKMTFGQEAIFVALKGAKSDGHAYLSQAYSKGIRSMLISQIPTDPKQNRPYTRAELSELYPKAHLLKVPDTLAALQTLARHYRQSLNFPIISITGSNGKTIIKEWLYAALSKKYKVGKSPLSYNSQLGVAVSLLQLKPTEDIAIVEAGISLIGEMSSLAEMTNAEIGIFSNIRDAHAPGFNSKTEKLREKLKLFKSAKVLIYNRDQTAVHTQINKLYPQIGFSWGLHKSANLIILQSQNTTKGQVLELACGDNKYQLTFPFSNAHMIENAMHVVAYLVYDKWNEAEMQEALMSFSTLPNRLELRRGKKNCLIINDSYSSDLASLQLALEQLDYHAKGRSKVAFISALADHTSSASYKAISKLLSAYAFSQIITIGMDKGVQEGDLELGKGVHKSYGNTAECLAHFDFDGLGSEAILVKGATSFGLHKITDRLSQQVHNTCLETNLSAIAHNLNIYRSKLQPETKIMAVIKAQAYGSGSIQLAQFLESQGIGYLAVALMDEAIELRENGCQLPLMIFNVQTDSLEQLWKHQIEPEVYSFEILERLIEIIPRMKGPLAIHLKIETGMHRLGFDTEDLDPLAQLLIDNPQLKVASIFSHLSASENPKHDDFTHSQAQKLDASYTRLAKKIGYTPLKHILNTSGIVRFPMYQADMVRLGLGLYGIDETTDLKNQLQIAHTLKAKVLQIKSLKAKETTGYNRMGITSKPLSIAVISLGYADGLMRLAGNGKYSLMIGDRLYKTIGNICMDVSMVELEHGHNIKVGDEVLVFGPELSINALAKACHTISYEIISRIAPRVKRTYIFE